MSLLTFLCDVLSFVMRILMHQMHFGEKCNAFTSCFIKTKKLLFPKMEAGDCTPGHSTAEAHQLLTSEQQVGGMGEVLRGKENGRPGPGY